MFKNISIASLNWDEIKTTFFFFLAILLAVLSVYWTLNYFIELSSFSIGFAKGILCVYGFFLYDKIVLRKVDTLTEIKQGNIAYAIFLFAHAYIFAACISVA